MRGDADVNGMDWEASLKPVVVFIALIGSACVPVTGPVTRLDLLASYSDTCRKDYGFAAGSPALSQCVMQMDANAKQAAVQKRQAVGAALQNMGNGMRRNAGVSCTSTTYGATTYANCS